MPISESPVFNDDDYDDFDDEWTDAEQNVIDLMAEIDEHAKECILHFFEGRKWHCGGAIPQRALISQEKIDIIEQIEFVTAVDLFYEAIKLMADKNPDFRLCGELFSDGKYYDMVLLRKLMLECEAKRIPQNRIGGILLIYLDVVVGIPLDWTALMVKVKETKKTPELADAC
jgi:hypothetical protein